MYSDGEPPHKVVKQSSLGKDQECQANYRANSILNSDAKVTLFNQILIIMLCRCHNMSFRYKLKLHFRRPINQQGKRFRKFSSTLIHQPMPKVREFMDIQPPSFKEVDNTRMKFFWRKPAFKFPRFEECLLGLTLTKGNGTHLKTLLDSYTSKQQEHVLILEKCQVRKIILTYLFKGDYPDLKIHSAPNFCPPFRSNIFQDDNKIVNNSVAVESKALRMKNVCNYRSLIVASFVLSLTLPTILIGKLMTKWRKRNLNLARRSRFQHQERRAGQIEHITFDQARGLHCPRDNTEEVEEKEQSTVC